MVGKVLYHLYFQGCPMNSALDSFDLFYFDNKNMKLVNVNFIYVVKWYYERYKNIQLEENAILK